MWKTCHNNIKNFVKSSLFYDYFWCQTGSQQKSFQRRGSCGKSMLCLFIIEKTLFSEAVCFFTDCPFHPASVMWLCLYCKFFISFWVYSVGYKNNNNNNKIMRKDCHKFTVLRFRGMSLAPESHLAAEPVHSSNF